MPRKKKIYKLCLLTKNKTNPAYIGGQIGAARLAKTLGCELVTMAPETPDDVGEQIALLDQAIASKPDAIIISPVHTTALNDSLRRAISANIPLIFFVTTAQGVRANCFVTSNNHTLAANIADHLFSHLKGFGNVAIIEGLPQSPTSAPRTRGFLDACKAYPGIKIVAQGIGNYQWAQGKKEMAKILNHHERIDGVLSANDIMAVGALEALEEAGRSAVIVGMNAMPDAIKAIKDEKMLATVSFDALSLICIGVRAAVRILNGKTVPKLLELPAEIVDINNCDAWDVPYEQRALPEWDLVAKIG